MNESEFSPLIDNSENASIIQLDVDSQIGLSNECRKQDEDLLELLNIKKARACLLSRQMNENGLIEIIGRGAGKRYRLK